VASRRWLKPFITIAFYTLLAAFLVIYVVNTDWSTFADIDIDARFLVLAAIAALGFRYWQTFIWITVLRGLGAHDVRMNAELIHVYAKSWLGRYIPGTAPWILGKIYFASLHGVSKSKLAVGSLLEGAIQIAVLLVTSSVLLLLDPRLDVLPVEYSYAMIAVIVVSVIALLPPVFNLLIGLAFRILRRPGLSADNKVGPRTILIAAGQYTVGALMSGLSLFFIVKALYPALALSDALFVIASGNLAGAASMLAIFAPGGIGVREGIQLLLLGIVIPGAIALVAVVFTRVWGIFMDLAFFGLGAGGLAIKKRRKGPETGSAASSDMPN